MQASFYPYLAAFCWIGIFLMIGTILRAKVKFFQTLLFPASLIGGILGFIVINMGWLVLPSSDGLKILESKTFTLITSHLFAFGFVGVGLLQNKRKEDSKIAVRGGIWIGILFTSLFAVQALIGKGVFLGWKLVSSAEYYVNNGYLLGAGFTQGPGQTAAYAGIWEQQHQIANAVNTGLAFAAVGFLVAGLVGVPMAFYGIRRGWLRGGIGNARSLPDYFLKGIMNKDDHPPCAHHTTHASNIDTIGFHLGLMCAIYGGAYLFSLAWQTYMPSDIKGLGFGFLFVWGMFLAMFVRKVMSGTGTLHLIDPEMSRRLTGTTVDFMICSVFMGIEVKALQDVAVPFLVSIVLATVVTVLICMWFGRRAPEFGFERMLALFGLCTGTVASGLLLLRIVDPEFDTTVAVELGLFNIVTVFIFTPISFSMPFVPAPGPFFDIFDSYPIGWIFLLTIVACTIAMFASRLVTKRNF